jgi:heme oxygenase
MEKSPLTSNQLDQNCSSLSSQMSASEYIKMTTSGLHEEVEKFSFMATLVHPSLTLEQYGLALKSLASRVIAMEDELSRLSTWQGVFPSVSIRPNKINLIEDLKSLNQDLDSQGLFQKFNSSNLETAAGILYVLEGSANGSRYLSRIIQSRLSLNSESGLKYFLESARDSRERWSRFKIELDLAIQTSKQKQMMRQATEAAFKIFLN